MRDHLIFILGLAAMALACGPKAQPPGVATPDVQPAAVPGLRLQDAVAVPRSYRVSLSLDPSNPAFVGVLDSELDITRDANDFYLNGHGLTVQSAVLIAGGERYDLSVAPVEEEWLHFRSERPFPAGAASLQVRYTGTIDEQSSYGVFRQKVDEDWYIFTQFEARGARRAFPIVDQPDHKVPLTLSLEVPENMVALANTPEVARAAVDGGRVSLQFATTKPLPAYLIAFAVGPFDMVDIGMTRSKVPVRVAAPRGRGDETAWVAESTLPILEILEDYLGSAYPFAKLDLVSIPATGSFGAMENPGLITYTETLLLSKSNSLDFRKAYARVGAHELAHQWFGNLVTNAWWDDIWLNESFATWAAAKAMAKFKPEWRAERGWLSQRERAMGADRLASARIIRQPIVIDDDIAAAFDGITYAKGASVLAMFEAWLGEELFQEGIQHYLRSHAWQAATAADFVGAMDEGTGEHMSTPFLTFLNEPGTPLVSFTLACDADSAPVLTMQQSRYAPLGSKADLAQQYQVPVCVRFPGAEGPVRQCSLLTEASQTLVLDQAASCPAWIIPNAGGTGYYRSELSAELAGSLFNAAPLSNAELLVMAKDLQALVWAGRAPIASMLALVPTMANSKDDAVVATAAELANLGRLVKEQDQVRYQKWLGKHFGQRARALGWVGNAGEPADRKDLRSTLLPLMIFEGEDKRLRAAGVGLAQRWLQDPGSVDADAAGLALEVMAWRGEADLFDSFVAAIKSTSDRSRRRLLLGALGAASNPELAKRVLGIMLDPEISVRESQRTLSALSSQPKSGALALAFLLANFDALAVRYGEEMGSRLARVAGAQCDPAQRGQIESLLRDKISSMQGGQNAANQALEAYDLCVAAKASLALPAKL